MRKASRAAWILVPASAALAIGLAGVFAGRSAPVAGGSDGPEAGLGSAEPIGAAPAASAAASAPVACSSAHAAGRSLAPPSDLPARLGCREAHRVAEQARANLAQPPSRPDAKSFAEATRDWLDPHGLWSAAPDAPVAPALKAAARPVLASLENEHDDSGCAAAASLGPKLEAWVSELRAGYDASFERAAAEPGRDDRALAAASEPMFENGPVTRGARELAIELGARAGLVAARLDPGSRALGLRARARLFPPLDAAGWGEAVLAAALRAYVLQLDPHGAWAPLDEESSLYEVELEASGRTRLWRKMSRTAVGLRIDEGPLSPLVAGDVVLAVGEVPTAGLTVEQAEQLGILDPSDATTDKVVTVLRAGAAQPLALRVALGSHAGADDEPASVTAEALPYGDGVGVVLRIQDVPDDLGEQVATVLAEQRGKGSPSGVLLDLRGNGGGSTDGARSTLGLFLPGAPLFPMRRRDGRVEVERATEPAETDRWTGAVAVLVDGATASAAEMIAGALGSYHRGPVLGSRTYGKGCAQEYMDDEAGVGVLRLTTLVYALPDGSPVQRVGLRPNVLLPTGRAAERETSLGRTFAPWAGPDVRDRARVAEVAWPAHGGNVGPCGDELVCKALRTLGAPRSATARSSGHGPRP
jgi:carboxyl-terminal processing protease